jgi:hypothetical protein
MKRTIIVLLAMSLLLQSTPFAVGQASVTLYPIADNYADSKYPELGHYGKTAFLYVGNSYDHAQDIWGSERIYIRFNLKELPKEHVILNATLILWQYYAPKTDQTYETHRVLGEWDETAQNWNTQPPWSMEKASETVAPATEGVAVKWDITNDVQAWYSSQTPNYGTMIKVAEEGQAKDASSGFWSREYPVGSHEEWRPRLVVTLEPVPSAAYSVTISTAGLTAPSSSTIYVDGQKYGSISAENTEKILFVQGTSHNVTLSKYVSGPTGIRYICEGNQASVSATGSHLFTYTLEYEATFYADPPNLFQLPSSGWYKPGQELTVKRIGPDVVDIAPGARLVFDGWQLNSHTLTNEPGTIVLDRPITLEAHYRTEYYLNVTSPIGTTQGSGWYAKDSAASFSVDASAYPMPGFLGVLGVKHSFVRWVGSNELLGTPESPQGSVAIKEATTIEAVWQEDWSSAFTNTFLGLIALAVAVAIFVVRRRRGTKR